LKAGYSALPSMMQQGNTSKGNLQFLLKNRFSGIQNQGPSQCRLGEINGNLKLLGESRLDGGNYQEIVFRTPLIRQNRRFRGIGESNPLRNSVILYSHAGF
tara:strand:+ start:549 stop:851 length:303 start_codon:yes stop_codon:yes gene_type:complete